MKYPKIYLVLDNCYAIKRWIRPKDWMELSKEIGFTYVQASTDNEIDPLFATREYMDDWFYEVKQAEKETGIKVANFYTGYQTYRTAGLAHYDERVRKHLVEDWVKNLVARIHDLGAAGLGFSLFAVSHKDLQDAEKYCAVTDMIYEQMAEIAEYAYQNGKVQVSFEQMYAPHQPPFTIDGTKIYLKSIYEKRNCPAYVTIDVGHMTGQKYFVRPDEDTIRHSFGQEKCEAWLGSDKAYEIWKRAKRDGNRSEAIKEIIADMDKHTYLFSGQKDGDIYEWLKELAVYSPIIHMQQTDGNHASHAAFTKETNKAGIVTGEKLLRAIKESYDKYGSQAIQPPVEDIYLSFEIFAANTEKRCEIVDKLKQTLAYWRQFVPEDGISLGQII
ncbi:AP endonuclease [Christensenellaceae bacterium]|nr:AP endonuclease [Christensenellaceae bacterium]BDF59938.1 AP endonuclease [Christensenellaceae bacterium]